MEPVLYEHKVQYYETNKMDCVHHSNYCLLYTSSSPT